MKFSRVMGITICTIKYEGLEGLKLFIVQSLDKTLQSEGGLVVAVDVVKAGPGDICVTAHAREAALAMPEITFVPVDLSLVGIVDEYEVRPDGEIDFTMKPGWVKYT